MKHLKKNSKFKIDSPKKDTFDIDELKSEEEFTPEEILLQQKEDELAKTSSTNKILQGKLNQYKDTLKDFHNHNGVNSELINILDLIGFIQIVTTVPTHTPKKFIEQLLIYTDSITSPTDTRLYIYSFKGNVWNFIQLNGLAGTKVYYVSDSSGGAVTRKLTFVNGILTSET